MSSDSENSTPSTGKRPLISLRFLIVVGALAVVGFLAGPWIMTQFMLMQESNDAKRVVVPDEFAGLSELAKSLQSDPENASFEGMSIGAGGPPAAGGSGGFDPESRFQELDADSNGALEGDEISERLAARIADIDADGNGAISKDEFLAVFEAMRSGRGNQASSDSSSDDAQDTQSSSSQTAN